MSDCRRESAQCRRQAWPCANATHFHEQEPRDWDLRPKIIRLHRPKSIRFTNSSPGLRSWAAGCPDDTASACCASTCETGSIAAAAAPGAGASALPAPSRCCTHAALLRPLTGADNPHIIVGHPFSGRARPAICRPAQGMCGRRQGVGAGLEHLCQIARQRGEGVEGGGWPCIAHPEGPGRLRRADADRLNTRMAHQGTTSRQEHRHATQSASRAANIQ